MRIWPLIPALLGSAALAAPPPNPQIPLHVGVNTDTDTSTDANTDAIIAPTPYNVQKPPLDTDWTYKVGTNPWPEHPRPQLRRDRWHSLNGIWTYRRANSANDIMMHSIPDGPLDRETMIPSCVESGLSGLQDLDVEYMWFNRPFRVPAGWDGGERVLLHFEAVDYEAVVYVNGHKLATNVGGYFRFSVDVTDYVDRDGENRLTVFVHDPTDRPGSLAPIGKQTTRPSHIFYRACSGIWQTVWLESVPAEHITGVDMTADMHGEVTMTVHSSSNARTPVSVTVTDAAGTIVATFANALANNQFAFTVPSPALWSPDSPTLYNLTVTLGGGRDTVSSYTAFRTVSRGVVNGVQRPLLNGEFVFQFGTLDQGYWPDGLHLAPNREAMVSDLLLLKGLGMNMVRKHIKVEPDLFYRACDELGIMVIQDMPSMCADGRMPDDGQQAEFARQLETLVREHRNYPSIVTWVVYNEGWAQRRDGPPWPEERLVALVKGLDPTRLVVGASGWNDHGFGDFSDNHHYATPQCGTPFYSLPASPHDSSRIGFAGEFGGLGLNTTIEHLWNVPDAIRDIPQTYEIHQNLASYNYRARLLLRELADQVRMFECSGAVYTQTSDVEGEVNGLVTYDRRVKRVDSAQWKEDIQALYDAAATRGGKKSGRS